MRVDASVTECWSGGVVGLVGNDLELAAGKQWRWVSEGVVLSF